MKNILKNKFIILAVAILLIACCLVTVFSQNANLALAEPYNEIRYADKVTDEMQATYQASTEVVTYTNREDDYYETTNSVPFYEARGYLSNSCGPTAGAIVVGFYDKYYEELIPNFKAYYPATGKYKFDDKVYVPKLMEDLYSAMRCNIDDVGVNESDCLNGLRSYCESKGRKVSYSSVATSGGLNATAYLNAINNNQPIILFNKATELYDMNTTATEETWVKFSIPANHVYVGFGYYVVRYYNGNNNFRTDTYLRVACGRADYDFGLIRIASTASTITNNWFVNGYAVSIT